MPSPGLTDPVDPRVLQQLAGVTGGLAAATGASAGFVDPAMMFGALEGGPSAPATAPVPKMQQPRIPKLTSGDIEAINGMDRQMIMQTRRRLREAGLLGADVAAILDKRDQSLAQESATAFSKSRRAERENAGR